MRSFIGLFCAVALGMTPKSGLSQSTIVIEKDTTMTVQQVFDLIMIQSDYLFLFEDALINELPPVSLQKGKISAATLIQQSLAPGDIKYEVNDSKQIRLYKDKTVPIPKQENDKSSNVQQYQITGTVTDSNGEPIGGVNIVVSGKGQGTISDFDGTYTITATPQDTLTFSFIGFKTEEIAVKGRTSIDVMMKEDIMTLEGVEVNAGYYTVKERERTGNIARVTAEEIELQPVVNPLQALQGRMAGVEIVQRSGVPGTAPNIQIRGQNSLRNSFDDNGNLPLYIIDGVPVNSSPLHSFGGLTSLTGIDPLNTLNMSNIESIEVLKDADATAIYGSRGANGVILITTKSGKGFERKTEVEARLYSGVGQVSNRMKLLNTRQYLVLRKEAFENDGVTPTEVNAKDLLLWDQNRYTDWQKELFGGTAVITDVNLAISGGNETTSFRLGGSYHKEGTVFLGDFGYHKVTGGLNVSHRSKNEKFRMDVSVNYGVDHNDQFNGNTFVSDALSLPPNAPQLYNHDGSLNWENSTWINPLDVMHRPSKAQANNLVSNLGISYELTTGLHLKANMGYTSLDSEEKVKLPVSSYDPALSDRVSHRSFHSLTKRKSWIIEPQLVYNRKIGQGSLDALIGATFQQSENNALRITATGYANEQLIGNLAAADAVSINLNQNIDYRYNALFARIGYNWKKKYFINLTGRRDGSSRFGPNKRFANFGAIGGAWIFSEEDFIKHPRSFLSFGKLRGSYGTTGNDQIGDYGYLDTYEATPGPGGLYPTQLTNPDYSWESNKKLEAALELGFLRDRIHFNISWYRNRSSNQLVGYPLPAITGFTTVQANLPATVQNTGWEFELSTFNFQSKGFRWKTFMNLSLPRNQLVDFPGIEQTSYQYTYRVGQPLSIALLYQYDGIDPETGLYRVVDINQDGRFDFDDRVVVKNLGRKYFGGINNELTYKNLALGFLFEFVKQDGFKPSAPAPGRIGNFPVDHLHVWRNEGDNADIQKASQSIEAFRTNSNARNSDFVITDASFIRLKTLSLSYALPPEVLKELHVQRCKIFLHAQNLFTITNYNGLDPQSPDTSLPVLRTLTCGIQLNF